MASFAAASIWFGDQACFHGIIVVSGIDPPAPNHTFGARVGTIAEPLALARGGGKATLFKIAPFVTTFP
jgi:hypothetical protein